MTLTPKVRQIAFGVYVAIRNRGDAYHPVCNPAISVMAVTRCSEYEKKVSLWVKKKLDNDLHDNTK